MFDFLSYSFGSVFGGCITALIIAGTILFLSIKQSNSGELNPLAAISCVILFCLLFFQITWVYIAIGSKGLLQDLIGAIFLQWGDRMNGLELKETIENIIRDNPIFSFFIHYADLQSFDWSDPYSSLNNLINGQLNGFIVRRCLWSILFIVVFGGIIWYLETKGSSGKKYTPSSHQERTLRRGNRGVSQRRTRQRI